MLHSIIQGLVPYKKRLFAIILLFVFSSVCEMGFALCMGYIADTSLQYNVNKLFRLLVLIASVAALQILVDMVAALLSRRLQGYIQRHLDSRFVKAILSAAYKKINTPGLLTCFTNDLPGSVKLLASETITLVSKTLLFIVVLIAMLWMKPIFTLLFLIFASGMILIQIQVSKPIGKYTGQAVSCLTIYNAQVLDSLQNAELITAYGLEKIMLERCDKSLQSFLDASRQRLKCFLKLILTAKNAMYVPLILTYIVCGYDVSTGSITPGIFLAYTTLATHANAWIRALSGVLSSMRESGEHLKRFESCVSSLSEQTVPVAPDRKSIRIDEENEIMFDDVTFGFGETTILDHVSLCIRRGEKIAIVGENGTGKSTTLKLMLGIYEPQSGNVRVFDHNAGESERGEIAYVAQEDFFLPASIQENIAFGAESAYIDAHRLREAAWCADIDTFILSLPMGFDTTLEDNGENFSGGQRQRIALARAVYCDASILLLDEATSALDPPGEATVLERILEREHEKTIVFVTHNPAVAILCDRVLTLRGGKLTESTPTRA